MRTAALKNPGIQNIIILMYTNTYIISLKAPHFYLVNYRLDYRTHG